MQHIPAFGPLMTCYHPPNRSGDLAEPGIRWKVWRGNMASYPNIETNFKTNGIPEYHWLRYVEIVIQGGVDFRIFMFLGFGFPKAEQSWIHRNWNYNATSKKSGDSKSCHGVSESHEAQVNEPKKHISISTKSGYFLVPHLSQQTQSQFQFQWHQDWVRQTGRKLDLKPTRRIAISTQKHTGKPSHFHANPKAVQKLSKA